MDNFDHKLKGIEEPNVSKPGNYHQHAQKSKTLDQKSSAQLSSTSVLKRTHSWYDFMVSPFTCSNNSGSSSNSADHKLRVAEACCQTNPRRQQGPNNEQPSFVQNTESSFNFGHKIDKSGLGVAKNKHKTLRSSDKLLAHKACQTPGEWAKDLELDLFAITATQSDYRKTNGIRSQLNARDSYRNPTLKLRVVNNNQHSKCQAGGNLEIDPNSYLGRSMAQTFKSVGAANPDSKKGKDFSSTLLKSGKMRDANARYNGVRDCSTFYEDTQTNNNSPPSLPNSVQNDSISLTPSPQNAISYPLSTSPLDSEAIIAEIEKFCLKHGVTDTDAKGDSSNYDTKCDGRIPPLPFQNNITSKYLNDATYVMGEDQRNHATKSPVTTARTDEQNKIWPKIQGDTCEETFNNYSDEEQTCWDDMKKFYKERIIHMPLALNVKKPSENVYTIPDFSQDKIRDFKGYNDRTSPDGAPSPPTIGPQGKVISDSNDSKSTRECEGEGKDVSKKNDHYEQEAYFEGKGNNRFQYLPVPTKVNFVLKPSVYSAFSAVNNYGRFNDSNHNNTKPDDISY